MAAVRIVSQRRVLYDAVTADSIGKQCSSFIFLPHRPPRFTTGNMEGGTWWYMLLELPFLVRLDFRRKGFAWMGRTAKPGQAQTQLG